MKLATAWIAPRIKSALKAHRKDTDLPAPNLPSGRLHPQQLFDSGEHRGCHQALIMLISVMQGLKLQGKPSIWSVLMSRGHSVESPLISRGSGMVRWESLTPIGSLAFCKP